MILGDPIRPDAQPITTGGVVRLYKALPAADPSNLSTFSGPSPMTGKVIKAANAASVLGIEGGYGVSTANAESYWGIRGKLLRKKVRIDKCPWPDGQQDIRIRCTINYSQGTGGVAASSTAPPVTVTLQWNRNTTKIFTLLSGTTPSNPIQEGFGFGPGNCSVDFSISARGVGVGFPLVQNDGNPYTQTFVTLDANNATFSSGADFWYTAQSRHHELPCDQWSTHHINFPGDTTGFFTAASFAHGPIGLVMSVDYTIEAVGWDTGFDDDSDAQGFEYPDYPGSPFNAGISP